MKYINKDTNKTKEKFLKILIKHKIVSTLLPFIEVDDNYNYLRNKNNDKIFFMEEHEKTVLKNLKNITFEEFNLFYYQWLSLQLEIIKTKRRNKEVIIEEIEVFNELNDSTRYLQIETC